MKLICLILFLTSSLGFASSETFDSSANQEELVVNDLQQIQNHGKKWHSKLKKATTVIKSPVAGRQALNEG